MTDQELQELKDTRDNLETLRKSCPDLFTQIATLDAIIEKEERFMSQTPDQWVETVKDFFDNNFKTRKNTSSELWTVEVNGKRICSSKGKYTWTSYSRAFNGICDYIYYNDYDIARAVDGHKVDLRIIIDELIREGYIKIVQIA